MAQERSQKPRIQESQIPSNHLTLPHGHGSRVERRKSMARLGRRHTQVPPHTQRHKSRPDGVRTHTSHTPTRSRSRRQRFPRPRARLRHSRPHQARPRQNRIYNPWRRRSTWRHHQAKMTKISLFFCKLVICNFHLRRCVLQTIFDFDYSSMALSCTGKKTLQNRPMKHYKITR